MAISGALQKIYAVAPMNAYYKEAISLTHSTLPSDLHLTNAEFEFTGGTGIAGPDNVQKFVPMPFSIKLPIKDTTGSQQLQIVFSNVEQDLIDDIERMARKPYEPVIFHYRIFIHGVVNAAGAHIQQLNPAWRMEIAGFNVTDRAITAVAAKINTHNKPFPKVLYTPEEFPGLAK